MSPALVLPTTCPCKVTPVKGQVSHFHHLRCQALVDLERLLDPLDQPHVGHVQPSRERRHKMSLCRFFLWHVALTKVRKKWQPEEKTCKAWKMCKPGTLRKYSLEKCNLKKYSLEKYSLELYSSGHVALSLWSNVWKGTNLWDYSFRVFSKGRLIGSEEGRYFFDQVEKSRL